MDMAETSTDKLIRALQEAGAPRPMIRRAQRDEYNDFRSRSATPIADLVRDARAAGLEDIAQRAIQGDFDATVEESDAWAASPEGQETFREFFESSAGAQQPQKPSSDVQEAVVAAADLVGRAGAKGFEIGYLHDDVPVEEAAWWCQATYQGRKVIVENHIGPAEAAQALAVRLLTGARCRCGKLVALSAGGAIAFPDAQMADGTRWSAEEAAAAGQCQWKRVGDKWEPSCDAPSIKMDRL